MKKINLILPILLSLIGLVSANGVEGTGYCGMMGGMMTGIYGYGGMAFGWLFGILVLVALVLLIVWLIKQIQKK